MGRGQREERPDGWLECASKARLLRGQMAGGRRIIKSKSCTRSPARSRCEQRAAAFPPAPSMPRLFSRRRRASGHQEQPGWAGTHVESSLKMPRNHEELLNLHTSSTKTRVFSPWHTQAELYEPQALM